MERTKEGERKKNVIMSSAIFLQDRLTRRWSHEGVITGDFAALSQFLNSLSEQSLSHPDPKTVLVILHEADLINNCQPDREWNKKTKRALLILSVKAKNKGKPCFHWHCALFIKPPVEWMGIFLSSALCILGGFPYTVRAPARCAVTKRLSECSYIEAHAEGEVGRRSGRGNTFYPLCGLWQQPCESHLSWCSICPQLRHITPMKHKHVTLCRLWQFQPSGLATGRDWSSISVMSTGWPLNSCCPHHCQCLMDAFSIQGAVATASWKDASLETFPLVLLCLMMSLPFFLYHWHSSSVHKHASQVLQARKADWGRVGLNDDALTQVCVMRFAELLLPTEAQLEPRLVRPAQGVSILQGGEGIAGVAVCDEAKIVPGGGRIAASQSLNEILDEIHVTSTERSINVVWLLKAKTQWTWRFLFNVPSWATGCVLGIMSCLGLGGGIDANRFASYCDGNQESLLQNQQLHKLFLENTGSPGGRGEWGGASYPSSLRFTAHSSISPKTSKRRFSSVRVQSDLSRPTYTTRLSSCSLRGDTDGEAGGRLKEWECVFFSPHTALMNWSWSLLWILQPSQTP